MQSAAALPHDTFALAPIDLYNLLRHLRLHGDRKGRRRGLRLELVPGEAPRLVLEPWEMVLAATAGDRIWSKLPASYRAQLVCTSIATAIIYREGLDYPGDVPSSHLADLALAYVLRERRNRELVRKVESSGLPDAGEIAGLLRVGGTRAALKLRSD